MRPFSLTGLLQESPMCKIDKEALYWSGVDAWVLSLFLAAFVRHLRRVSQGSQGSTEHSFKTTGLDAFVLQCLPCQKRKASSKTLPSFAWAELHWWVTGGHRGCHWVAAVFMRYSCLCLLPLFTFVDFLSGWTMLSKMTNDHNVA